jgi:hypothetical protein
MGLVEKLRPGASGLRSAELSPSKRWFWWEARRPYFNLVVGLAGLAGTVLAFGFLVAMSSLDVKLPASSMDMPEQEMLLLLFVLAYGIMANIAYSLGALTEWLVLRTKGPVTATAWAEFSFAWGIVFSVLSTLWVSVVFSALVLL